MYNGDCIRETCFTCLHDGDCSKQLHNCDNCYWYVIQQRSIFPHWYCIKDDNLPEQTKNGKNCELYQFEANKKHG